MRDLIGAVLGWYGWAAVTLIAVTLGLIAALAFTVAYPAMVGRSWWRIDGRPNHFGRYLMERKLLLAALFGVVLGNRLAGDWAAREMVTALLMLGFAVQTFVPYRLLLMAQDQREAKAEEDGDAGEGAGDGGAGVQREPEPGAGE